MLVKKVYRFFKNNMRDINVQESLISKLKKTREKN